MICKYCLGEQGREICEACDKRMSRFFGLVHKLTGYKPLPPIKIPHLGMDRREKEPEPRRSYTYKDGREKVKDRKKDVIPWPDEKEPAAKKKSA